MTRLHEGGMPNLTGGAHRRLKVDYCRTGRSGLTCWVTWVVVAVQEGTGLTVAKVRRVKQPNMYKKETPALQRQSPFHSISIARFFHIDSSYEYLNSSGGLHRLLLVRAHTCHRPTYLHPSSSQLWNSWITSSSNRLHGLDRHPKQDTTIALAVNTLVSFVVPVCLINDSMGRWLWILPKKKGKHSVLKCWTPYCGNWA